MMRMFLCFLGGLLSGIAANAILRAADHVGPWEIAVFLIAPFM